jgi:radical SAM/Cys-rich protein
MTSLTFRDHPLAAPRAQRDHLESLSLPVRFEHALTKSTLAPLAAVEVNTLQVNVGKLCNQTCRHCHVDAGPDRTEIMSLAVAQACLDALKKYAIPTLDITGGAPEVYPHIRELVNGAADTGTHIMHRCNLTSLLTGPCQDLPELFARHNVEIVASLPYYMPKQTDAQRGLGVFEKSIEALKRLNEIGYGQPGSKRTLHLVTNPVGAFLPGNQVSLEKHWRNQLSRRYDVVFNELYTITNMPISRFLEYLEDSGNLQSYMERLVQAFNPQAAAGVMCRYLVSVSWDGRLYDCDFNQMLELGLQDEPAMTIFDFDPRRLAHRRIATGQHCFGCTAGGGSSCGGATA